MAAALARRAVPERRVFFARWGFFPALLVLLAMGVAGLAWGRLAPEGLAQRELWGAIAVEVVGLALVVPIARRYHPDAREALGLRPDGQAGAALAALPLLAAALPLVLGANLVWRELLVQAGVEGSAQPVLSGILAASGPELVLAILLAVVAAPVIEELLFRAFLQPLLTQNFGEPGGLALTALLFGAAHGARAALGMFLLGLALGWIQLRTQRLLGAIALHALWNLAVLAAVLLGPEACRSWMVQ